MSDPITVQKFAMGQSVSRLEERSLVFGVSLAKAQIAGVYTRTGVRITGSRGRLRPRAAA